jgi:hypothetical protein
MLAAGQLFIPLWTYFIALATGAIVVIPLGWLYALSNFQLVRKIIFYRLPDLHFRLVLLSYLDL